MCVRARASVSGGGGGAGKRTRSLTQQQRCCCAVLLHRRTAVPYLAPIQRLTRSVPVAVPSPLRRPQPMARSHLGDPDEQIPLSLHRLRGWTRAFCTAASWTSWRASALPRRGSRRCTRVRRRCWWRRRAAVSGWGVRAKSWRRWISRFARRPHSRRKVGTTRRMRAECVLCQGPRRQGAADWGGGGGRDRYAIGVFAGSLIRGGAATSDISGDEQQRALGANPAGSYTPPVPLKRVLYAMQD